MVFVISVVLKFVEFRPCGCHLAESWDQLQLPGYYSAWLSEGFPGLHRIFLSSPVLHLQCHGWPAHHQSTRLQLQWSLWRVALVWSPGPSGIQIFYPGIFGTGFCQIPGSRDFSGRDLPLFSIPGLLGNFSGIFRDFCFYFVCWSNHIIFTNLYHYHCHHHYGTLLPINSR